MSYPNLPLGHTADFARATEAEDDEAQSLMLYLTASCGHEVQVVIPEIMTIADIEQVVLLTEQDAKCGPCKRAEQSNHLGAVEGCTHKGPDFETCRCIDYQLMCECGHTLLTHVKNPDIGPEGCDGDGCACVAFEEALSE